MKRGLSSLHLVPAKEDLAPGSRLKILITPFRPANSSEKAIGPNIVFAPSYRGVGENWIVSLLKRGFLYQNTRILYFLPLITKNIIHLKYKVKIAKLPDSRKVASSVGFLYHNFISTSHKPSTWTLVHCSCSCSCRCSCSSPPPAGVSGAGHPSTGADVLLPELVPSWSCTSTVTSCAGKKYTNFRHWHMI